MQGDAGEPLRVGLYLGRDGDKPSNITKVLKDWDTALEPFDAEVFGSALLPETASDMFDRVDVDARGYPTPFGKICSIYTETVRYIRRRDPDVVVQCWRYGTHAPGVALAAARTGTPVVVRLSSDAFHEYQQCTGVATPGVLLLNNGIGRLPLRVADQVITLGPYGRDQALEHGAPEETVRILPPPASVEDRFTPADDQVQIRADLDLPRDRNLALFVGRLTPFKGMSFMSDVIDRTNEYSFVLVGDGSHAEELQSKHSNVITPGYVPHVEIHRYYQAADVYVHPSPLEGLPLVLLEALSCDLPVIARRAGDVGYVVEHVVETPSEMAQALRSGSFSATWLNEEAFEQSRQHRTLRDIVRTAAENHR